MSENNNKKKRGGVKSNRFYPEDFKRSAVKAVEEGRTPMEVAEAFKVSHSTVHAWLKQASSSWKPAAPRRHQRVKKELKLAMVQQVLQGRSVPEVAGENDVTSAALYKWMKQYGEDKDALARKVDLGLVMERLRQVDEGKERAKSGRDLAVDEEQQRVREMVADPLVWMQKYTETKDSHWRERGAKSPYRAFPDKPYFRPAIQDWQREKIIFIEKSRNMMLSWLAVGFFTHAAMTTAGIEILFQSQKEEKAFELVDYAKTLYDRQRPELKRAFPLTKNVRDMADGELAFANGSRIVGIPGGADQIRSYHPWGLLMDEAAFMPEAGDSYNNAVPVCQKIIMVSSAGPGWFADVCNSGLPLPDSKVCGFSCKQSPQGLIQRIHYSSDPDRGAEWVAEERRKYSSQGKWDREQEIVHEAGAGERIFAEVFSRWEEKILIDPADGFQVPPHWKRIAAFDHGKANPTAALVAAVDQDANLYILSEYYQPGLSPRQHRPNLLMLDGFMQCEALADPSIFFKNQTQSDGSFKAIADLYIEQGISNLLPAPDNAELTGIERILNHWLDLDSREPTLKIVCPRGLRDIGKPVYGVHNEGCPNLVWELRRARREELSAAQLQRKNPTERIVDKDNHLRDCLKYLCLAFIEPPKPTPEMKANEAIKDIPMDDATSRMIRWPIAYEDAKAKDEAPRIPMGHRGIYNLRRIEAMERRRNGMWMRNLFRDPGGKFLPLINTD